MQREINIAIGNRAPATYFQSLWEQCENGKVHYGGMTDAGQLRANLEEHCIPQEMEKKSVEDYDEFLQERRKLMAAKIRDYYRVL